MRIIFVSNLFPPYYLGGYEIRCQDIVNGLTTRGHSVSVLTSRYGVGKPSRQGNVCRLLRSSWDSHARVEKLWREVYDNHILRRTVARLEPDIISCWNLAGIPYSLVATAQRTGVPVMLHIEDDWLLHDDPWLSRWSKRLAPLPQLGKWVCRPLVERVVPTRLSLPPDKHWIFISEYRKRQHLDAGFPVANARVIHGGIPIELFAGRRFERFSSGEPPRRLLLAGVLTAAKGIHVAVEALGRLRRDGYKDLTLTIIGQEVDRPYADLVREQIRRHDLETQVTILRPMDRASLPSIFREHDILLFTPTVPEGFPLTILEAMASGLAVVSNSMGGHGEILVDGNNALTYPTGDLERLAECIRRLVDQPELARRLAETGHQLAHRDGGLEQMLDKYVGALQAISRQGA